MNLKLTNSVYLLGKRGIGLNFLLSLIIAFFLAHIVLIIVFFGIVLVGFYHSPEGEFDSLNDSEKWIRIFEAILLTIVWIFSFIYSLFKMNDEEYLYLVILDEGEFFVRTNKKLKRDLSGRDLENFGRELLDEHANLKLSELALGFRQTLSEKFDKRLFALAESKISFKDLSSNFLKPTVFKLCCSPDIIDVINHKFEDYLNLFLLFDELKE